MIDPVSEQDNLQLIFSRLERYLLEGNAFARSGLNRKSLAAALKTNEKYLVKAVRMYAGGKSLGDYIDSLRLEHACFLLRKYPEYRIEAVAAECGIASRASFYRLFRRYYGCCPGEYREKISGFPKNETHSSPK